MKDEDRRVFEDLKDDLIERARRISDKAVSWRHYHVGVAMLGWSPTDGYQTKVCANLKPKESGPRSCGEKALATVAHSEGWERVIAIIIVAEPQADDATGRMAKTLLPCWDCRSFLRLLAEVSDDTIILTVHNHVGTREERSFKQLLEFFDEY